jgi:hypothetical protein
MVLHYDYAAIMKFEDDSRTLKAPSSHIIAKSMPIEYKKQVICLHMKSTGYNSLFVATHMQWEKFCPIWEKVYPNVEIIFTSTAGDRTRSQ